MSAIIQKAMQDLRWAVPEEILNEAFIDNRYWSRGMPISVDARIREEVIENKVLPDINLVSGEEVYIPLAGVTFDRIDNWTRIYNIPKSLTHGRTITNALSISFGEQSYQASVQQPAIRNSSEVMSATQQIGRSYSSVPPVSTARVRLIGENTIVLEDHYSLPRNIYLRCMLENDSELSNIRPQSWPVFTKLVELAAKAYIYRKLTVRLDEGAMRGGREIGKFKEIVDDYADAQEMYEEHLHEKWRKTSILNDEVQRRRHLKSVMGGGH